MFCPNCGAEYREGFTVCSDCNVPLVTELPGEEEIGFTKLVTVYETGDPAVIPFAKSILQSEGIKYFIKGESLQDLFAGGRLGTGFNPVIGPVQIQVDENDVEKAKELLNQIEQREFDLSETDTVSEQTETIEDSGGKKHGIKGFLRGIIIGILISGIGLYVYDYKKKHFSGVVEYDTNKDSKPDLFYIYRNRVIVEVDEDRNFDGKVDLWEFYKEEIVDRGESDNDFDGRVDTKFSYENGVLSRVEIDTNNDNRPEIIEDYTHGVLFARSWYHESSRNLWKKTYLAGGVMREEYIDQDYDGTFDIKIIYNSSERPVKTDILH